MDKEEKELMVDNSNTIMTNKKREKFSFSTAIRKGVKSIESGVRQLGGEEKGREEKIKISDPVTKIEDSWNAFITKVWIMISYIIFTVVVLQFGGKSTTSKLFGFFLLVGIPIVAIGLLLSMIPTLKVGKYTIFSRKKFSFENQIKGSYKVSRFFFRRLYEVAPEVIYILIGVVLVLVLSVIFSFR